MNTRLIFPLALLLLGIACNDAKGTTAKEAVPAQPEKVKLASNKDLACGMMVSDDVKDTVHINGKIYGFCSPDCKKDFLKDSATILELAK